jgi:hypothetical protein
VIALDTELVRRVLQETGARTKTEAIESVGTPAVDRLGDLLDDANGRSDIVPIPAGMVSWLP